MLFVLLVFFIPFFIKRDHGNRQVDHSWQLSDRVPDFLVTPLVNRVDDDGQLAAAGVADFNFRQLAQRLHGRGMLGNGRFESDNQSADWHRGCFSRTGEKWEK